MKIKITDLLDQYYDDTIKLDTPPFEAPIFCENTPKKHHMRKPLMLVASLILAVCGAFLCYLSIPGSHSGDAFSDSTGEMPSQVFIDSVPEVPEGNDSFDESALSPETESTSSSRFLVAELDLAVPGDTSGARLLDITLDMENGEAIRRYELPTLQEALLGSAPSQRLTEAMTDPDFILVYQSQCSLLAESFNGKLCYRYPDESTEPLSIGLTYYADGFFVDITPLSQEQEHPVAIQFQDAVYSFTPDPDYAPPVRPQSLVVYPEDMSVPLSPAQDLDGDGILTANLNIFYEYDGKSGSILKLTLDPATGTMTWYQQHDYAAKDMFGDPRYIAWANYILLIYQNTASLIFSDGTSLVLGSGDAIGYSDGIRWEESPLALIAADQGINISGKEPAFIRIGDTDYHFQ